MIGDHSASLKETSPGGPMRVLWVNRWFLDYRISVYRQLDALLGGTLNLFFNQEAIPHRVSEKAVATLGKRATGFRGERSLIFGDSESGGDFANSYFALRYQPGLWARMRQLRPDVVVTEGFFRWSIPCLIYRLLFGVPLVMLYERTEHTERNVPKIVLLMRRLVLPLFSVVCCNGTETIRYVRSLGVPQQKITSGHMVADVQHIAEQVAAVPDERLFYMRSELGITSKHRVYIYVGQLVPRKGLGKLIDAWAEFETLHADVPLRLLVLGEGMNRADYEEKSPNSVTFVGKVDHDNIFEYLALAHVSVTPTLEDNWSMVVPEAMAASLPVMTTIYNGCHSDLVTPNNGWTVDPLSHRSFVAGLEATLLEFSELRLMGTASFEIISRVGTPEFAAAAIEKSCRLAVHT